MKGRFWRSGRLGEGLGMGSGRQMIGQRTFSMRWLDSEP